jgi:hypothetical protein
LTRRKPCGSIAAMSLIRGLFWLVLFAFFTFCFIVLFEHGTHDFSTGFKKEFERVKTFVEQVVNKDKTEKSPPEKKKK